VTKFGKLYLLPVPIGENNGLQSLPVYNLEVVRGLRHFIAEDAKEARRFLKLAGYPRLEDANIFLLNEHTRSGDHSELLTPLLNGENTGLMSDAGCPGIADPGADVVALAHRKGIEVVPLTGPSSIVLSIMASGFNGQNFAFVGYLPVDKAQRHKRIKELEQLAYKHRQAQFFIETPYRNEQMMETLLGTLNPATRLFLGLNINASEQVLVSRTIGEWKRANLPLMRKLPAVFGIYS
jgi:16S rRNA (cytidine1402-2'-O)-methyltransferase